MFPEAFAEEWIARLTKPADVIMDPFCGRGTTPFQALLMGRGAIANDINPVAYCVTKAKSRAPQRQVVMRRITVLEREAASVSVDVGGLPPFFRAAYDEETLKQLVFLRERLRWADSDTDAMVAALVLGALHGDATPTYLSNQMPRTISTKPAYSIRFWEERGLSPPKRDVFEVIRRAATYRYMSSAPSLKGSVFLGDMRDLPRRMRGGPAVRCAVTSPPYLDTTSFEEDQWLRLWFLGQPPEPSVGRLSPDDRHYTAESYWRLIADMWRVLGSTLAPRSHVVIRLGYRGNRTEEVVDMLLTTASVSRRRVTVKSYEESELKRRQTHSFRPGAKGFSYEIDAHFALA